MKITTIFTGTIETYYHLLSYPLVKDKNIRISVPVSCYLIEHKDKKILFDAGQTVLGYEQNPKANFFVKVTLEETTVSQLAAMNIYPDDIDYIIISHTHGDHCDGVKDFPHSKVVAQRDAAIQLKRFGNEIVLIDGKYDLLGDESIVCIPTLGHAPGHQSLLLTNNDGSQSLLIGDAIYFPEALEYIPSESEYLEKTDFFNSLRLLRTMQDNGVKLCFGHYPFNYI